MSDAERIDRLERIIVDLCWALARQGTEMDGNWGYKSFSKVLSEIVVQLPHSENVQKGPLEVKWLFDPRIFNFIIMGLYCLNAARWGVAMRWADMCYWLSALAITATVTFGYKHV